MTPPLAPLCCHLTVNTAILGTVGYYSYANWDKPSWDRRTVSAVSAGLIALWGTEGRVFIPLVTLPFNLCVLHRYIAERYRESRR
jgi:hypothetical protein